MKKKTIAVVVAVLIVLLALPVYSWLSPSIRIDVPSISGSTGAAFFAGGNGSPENPYLISEPVHLYNVAWLQYIGYFNLRDGTKGYNNGRAQSYFLLTKDITIPNDFTALPPIGTTQYPFHGNFNGGGFTIKNLKTANAKEADLITEVPDNAEFLDSNLLKEYIDSNDEAGGIMGFFGVIGDYSDSVNAVTGTTGYIKDEENTPEMNDDGTEVDPETNTVTLYTKAISVQNMILDTYTIQSDSTATTMGIVAGYVNAEVKDVLIGGTTTVNMAATKNTDDPTANVSDYTLVGHCTDPYKTQLSIRALKTYAPTITLVEDKFVAGGDDSGTAQGWGGSIAMDSLYSNLSTIVRTAGNRVAINPYTYYSNRYLTSNGTLLRTEGTSTGTVFYTGVAKELTDVTIAEKDYASVAVKDYFNVVFTTPTRNGGFDAAFTYISGGQQNVDYIGEEGTSYTAYTISQNGQYLMLSGTGNNFSLTSGADAATATKWVFENGYIYTITGSNTKYYLSVSENNRGVDLDVSAQADTVWSEEDGRLVYGSQYVLCFLSGKWQIVDPDQVTMPTGYYIHSGTNYLSTDDSSLSNNTSEADATVWYFSNNNSRSGQIYTYVNGSQVYLRYNDGLAVGTTSTNWTNNSNRLYALVWSGWSRNYYYIQWSGTTWTTVTEQDEATTLTFTEYVVEGDAYAVSKTEAGTISEITITQQKEQNMLFTPGTSTYIPLQMQKDGETCLYIPTNGNTGYITSGTWDETSSQGYPIRSGDIRVSQYSTSNLNGKTTVRIVNSSDLQNVKFDSISLDSYTNDAEYQADIDARLVKFKDSLDKYKTLINYGSNTNINLYGLHFMDGRINMDSLVTIPQAVINGTEYENYQVPADSITFSLKEKGYVNFFAATYFSGNNSFFSLHHIQRDENQKIISIREIEKIYEMVDTNGNVDIQSQCIYEFAGEGDTVEYLQYVDDKYVSIDAIPANYKLTFDLDWIRYPTDLGGWLGSGEAYYFEVPASPGEYALGSVDNRTGGYLLYLDISANAQEIERSTITECFDEEVGAYEYTSGAYFVEMPADATTKPAVPTGEAAAVTLGNAFTGAVTFNREGTVITANPTTNLFINAAEGVTFQDSSGDSIAGTSTTVYKYQRVTYMDRNLTTEVTTRTVITRKTDPDGNVEITAVVTTIAADGTETPADDETNAAVIDQTKSTNRVTYLNTAKPDDSITWSDVTAGTQTMYMKYHYADETVNPVNSFASLTTATYNETSKRTEYTWAGYDILITVNKTVDLIVTDYSYTPATGMSGTVTVNETEFTEKGTITVEPAETTS